MQILLFDLHQEVVSLRHRPEQDRTEVVQSVTEILPLVEIEVLNHFGRKVVLGHR